MGERSQNPEPVGSDLLGLILPWGHPPGMGTPHPLPFLLAAVAFIMKKVKANKPLFVKEAHGEDGKTRREHRQEQRRESKSLWRTALKTVLLAIAALALILAIDNALVFSVTLE